MMPLAQFQGVTKSYGSGNTAVTALRNIDLELFAGQLTLIEGPSGCGKTTLLEVLGLLLPPNQGKVFIEGELASGFGQRKSTRLRRRNVAFVFQDFNLLESLVAHDNIEIVAQLHGPDAKLRTRQALQSLGLTNRAHHRPSELSGGEKQRVAIGRALVSSARLLLADEPTANLDWSIGQSIVQTLSKIAHEQDRGVVVVSHDPRLEPFADRVITLLDGSIVAQRRAGSASTAIMVILAVMVAALGGWVMVIKAGDPQAIPPQPATMPMASADDVIASAPAVTEPPSRLIQLSCDRPGIITAINAQSGQQVAKDQVLVQLDDAEARTNLHLSQAQLASAKATLADLQAWTRSEEIDQSKAEVEADKARLAFAQSQYERMIRLVPSSAAAEQDVDRTRQNLEVSKAELQSAQAALAKALNGPTATALAQAQARVSEAEAGVEVARTALDRRQLRSPVTGFVLYVYMRPGEAIDLESPQPILCLAESGPMHLRADVDEADIGKIFVGQKIRATSESFDQTFSGNVVSMEPIMGRRNIRTNRPRERQDTRIREVVIELTDDAKQLPIDLMMTVRFLGGGKER
jgi:putative ABC transport system ATP-binding protein